MNPFRAIGRWFYDRLGLHVPAKFLREHKVPAASASGKKSWMYVLGSGTMLAFVVQIVTGIALVTIYVPSTESAHESLVAITEVFTMGWLVRAVHFFGASAMVILVLLHMGRVFLTASYKYPREMNWITGVLLFLLTAAMAFTGQLLRWDENGIWTVVVASKFLVRVPLIGRELAEFALAGDTVGGATLSRFYGLHVFILPALVIALLAAHLFLLIHHGVSEPPKAGKPVDPATYRAEYKKLKQAGVRYWPYMVWREATFGFLVLIVIFTLAITLGPQGPGAPPDPSAVTADPKPDWFFLWYYALLWIKSRGLETLVMVYLPIAGVVLLLLLPLVASRGERSPSRRPWAVAFAVAVALAFATLTWIGVRAPWSPSSDGPISAAKLNTEHPVTIEGAQLFHDRGCQLCHTVLGAGGKYGPDLTQVARRLSLEEIAVRTVSGFGDMPAYREMLSPQELNAILTFLSDVKNNEGGS